MSPPLMNERIPLEDTLPFPIFPYCEGLLVTWEHLGKYLIGKR
jgi:hypothetical protein